MDHSWGRDPDGNGPWREFILGETTPEYCNVCTNYISSLDIKTLALYPNPVSSLGYFTLPDNATIFDISGRLIRTLSAGRVEPGTLMAGTYLVYIKETTQILVVE